MNRYLIIIHEGKEGFGAYVPDLPEIVAVAKTTQEVLFIIQKATSLQLETLAQSGKPLPTPSRTNNAHYKTNDELTTLFTSLDPTWQPLPRAFEVSYFIPAEEEDREIREIIRDVEDNGQVDN